MSHDQQHDWYRFRTCIYVWLKNIRIEFHVPFCYYCECKIKNFKSLEFHQVILFIVSYAGAIGYILCNTLLCCIRQHKHLRKFTTQSYLNTLEFSKHPDLTSGYTKCQHSRVTVNGIVWDIPPNTYASKRWLETANSFEIIWHHPLFF